MAAPNSIFPFDNDRADNRALAVVQEMVNDVLATVRVARSLAQTERAIDLAGLDRDVGLLCARALDLPEQLGRRIGPQLRTLHNEIEALSLLLAPVEGDRI